MYKLFLFSRRAGKFGEKHAIIQHLKQDLSKHPKACLWDENLRLEKDMLYYAETTDHVSLKKMTQTFKAQVEDLGEASNDHQPEALIYVCGGDGSLHEVTHLLVGSKIGFAVLPTGSGNDFSKNFYASHQNFSLERCLKAVPEPIDVLVTSWENSINVLSFAYDVQVTVWANFFKEKFAWFGGMSYYLALLKALFLNRNYPMNFELEVVDEKNCSKKVTFEKSVTLAALCNGRYYGNGFTPSPYSDTQDGIAELCVVDALTLGELIKLIKAYIQGTHLTHPKVNMYRVKSGTLGYTPAYIQHLKEKKQEPLAEGEGIVFPCDRLEFNVKSQGLWHFRLP